MPLKQTPLRPLTATYRLQLNGEFTLDDARERIPYLEALGISHLYCSPILEARAGSAHGYDVTDPSRVSEALGGDAAFGALADAAHSRGMGIVLDIVPNHMGIGPDNPYWDDVLMHGEESRYAHWFDVGWRVASKRLSGKVLLPVLGDTLARVIDRGELKLARGERGIRLHYFDHSFPIDRSSIGNDLGDPRAYIQGEEGKQRLRALLRKQHYQLACWRTARRDLNYRRFFDVNDLISLRVERSEVFEATHRLVLQFVEEGLIDGVRVDHVDGLLEPRQYLVRLREAIDIRAGSRRIPIFVEKILASGEVLPADWPVDGTTGYEFMTAVDDVLIDERGHQVIQQRYRRGSRVNGFADVALACKRQALRGSLNADVRRIAPMLARLGAVMDWPVLGIAVYAAAIVELMAQQRVYRTYVSREAPTITHADRIVIEAALERARANSGINASALDALTRVFLSDWNSTTADQQELRLGLLLRIQQLGGPAAAKGIEDTAFYAYSPLTSRSEVGGDPAQPIRGSRSRLFARMSQVARRYPLSLNATTTHDTKRTADARARIDAISEYAGEWARALRRWGAWHAPFRSANGSRSLPSRAAEDFIYQALLAIWPTSGCADASTLSVISERLDAYIRKANREAKVSTNWTDPDAAYETATSRFIEQMLRDPQSVADFDEFVNKSAVTAQWNTITRLILHLMSPGTPDIYQGDEIWFTALVDPDNRRPVDWARCEAALEKSIVLFASADRTLTLRTLCEESRMDELKMFVLRSLLLLRREHPALFHRGSVEPLEARGTGADRVIAFRRSWANESVLVIASRTLAPLGHSAVGHVWGDTQVDLGDADTSGRWHCALHGGSRRLLRPAVFLRDLFTAIPATVLIPAHS